MVRHSGFGLRSVFGRTAGRLAAQTEFSDQLEVAVLVLSLQVLQQLAPLVHHLEQATPRMVVLLVLLEMGGQAVDAFGQEGDLDFGRPGVTLVPLEFCRNGTLLLDTQRHFPGTPAFRSIFRGGAFYRRRPWATSKF